MITCYHCNNEIELFGVGYSCECALQKFGGFFIPFTIHNGGNGNSYQFGIVKNDIIYRIYSFSYFNSAIEDETEISILEYNSDKEATYGYIKIFNISQYFPLKFEENLYEQVNRLIDRLLNLACYS